MPKPETVTLDFLGRQMGRLIGDVAVLKDDMIVSTPIAPRLDGTVRGLVQVTRAVHGRTQRMSRRIPRLEA
jgi:hypothetical protein